MSAHGCRSKFLCQHCFENAVIDFDLTSKEPMPDPNIVLPLFDKDGWPLDEDGNEQEFDLTGGSGNCMGCGAVDVGSDHCQE